MKHTTSDSDVTSLATPSPSRSPKRAAAYYVVSPSRDSRDDGGDKSPSTEATPVYNSPLQSPSHQSSIGPHSRASSASRFSGNLTRSLSSGGKSATRKRPHGHPHGHGKWWHEVDVIDEDDSHQAHVDDNADADQPRELSRSCIAACWFSILVLVFTGVCLVVWGAARRDKPSVLVKSLTVENFYAGEGSDGTGVPTKMVTMNCSLKIDVDNPSTMFGIHVSSTSIRLNYSQIPIASGQLEKFYQPKKSQHIATVTLHGEKTPLYGAGATFALTDTGGVPLTVDLAVRTRGYVIGRLVRVTHAKRVVCPVVVSSRPDGPIMVAQSACSYT